VITVLAVLKSGGAFVPLDPGYPSERLQYMIGAAKIPIVITDGAAPDRCGWRAGCIYAANNSENSQ